MEKTKFMSFYNGTPSEKSASRCYDLVSKALMEAGIFSDLTLTGALATIRVEVGKAFKPVIEASSGMQYEGRKELGNTQAGDGPKFKGRGYIQLTGRANYTTYATKLDLDLLNHPDIVLCPDTSAEILALYFRDRGVNVACNQKDWVKVRTLVNGGSNGLNDFLSIINQYIS